MTEINFEKELNQAQYDVATAGKGPHLVLAGAGSGKTRTLVDLSGRQTRQDTALNFYQ